MCKNDTLTNAPLISRLKTILSLDVQKSERQQFSLVTDPTIVSFGWQTKGTVMRAMLIKFTAAQALRLLAVAPATLLMACDS